MPHCAAAACACASMSMSMRMGVCIHPCMCSFVCAGRAVLRHHLFGVRRGALVHHEHDPLPAQKGVMSRAASSLIAPRRPHHHHVTAPVLQAPLPGPLPHAWFRATQATSK